MPRKSGAVRTSRRPETETEFARAAKRDWPGCEVRLASPTPSGLKTLVIAKARGRRHRTVRGIVFHFHGGPESREWGEARYERTFPELVRQGYLYVGWNYPGSIGMGNEWKRAPRRNWERVLIREWEKVRLWIQTRYEVPERDWALVGPSFGAMVALLIARHQPCIGRLVLLSPLVCLDRQVTRVRTLDPGQISWFRRRFSCRDRKRLSFLRSLADIRPRVDVISSGRDEVLGTDDLRAAIGQAREQGKSVGWRIQVRAFHYASKPRRETFSSTLAPHQAPPPTSDPLKSPCLEFRQCRK